MLWSVRGQESLGQVLLESLQVVELREAVKVWRGQGRDGARRPQVGRGQGVGGQGTGGQGVGGPLKVLQPGVQQRELTNLQGVNKHPTHGGLDNIHLWVGGSLLSPVERNIHWIEEDRIHVRHLLMWLVVELRVGQIHRHSDTSWTDMLVLQHSGADIIHQIILLFIVRPRPFAEFFALRINL